MTGDLETRRRRALYRAHHRGTKEMDWMLGRFADAHVAGMSMHDLRTFEELLAAPDPEIHAWLMDPQTYPQGAFIDMLSKIRSFHNV